MSLTDLLQQAAATWPDRTAIQDGSEAVSYGDLLNIVDAIAASLQGGGLAPGSRVGLQLPNSIPYVALTYALWRVRAIVVPIPMESTPAEASELADSMALDAVISGEASSSSVRIGDGLHLDRRHPRSHAETHGLDIAFIRFTSGTTSRRKGVVLSHNTIRDRIEAANKALNIGPDDTVVWGLPMAHHFLITIVLYLSRGATIVLVNLTLARSVLETVERTRATILYAAPFHYALLARDKSDRAMPSVRLAISTTCALPRDVANDFMNRYGLPLVQGLGVIELGLVSLNTGDPRERWHSVGRPLPDFEVRIIDPDEEGCGEVAVRGPGLLDAYADPWTPRERILDNGWFMTNDLGRLDEEGFLFLISRKTAVINLAGRKVFPEEIEAVINQHPDVVESRVYGRPHPHLGEVVEAEVVLREPGADMATIGALCAQHLASYKRPSRFHVVNTLPRTPTTGKILRRPLVQHD